MELDKWPFGSEAASRLLDADLIQEQGEFYLRRGLNIRRLIAFVGSGVSMAYGRVSWGELAEIQVAGIIKVVDAANARAPLDSAITKLKTQLADLQRDVNEEKSEAILLSLQIAEQIWSLAGDELCKALCLEFHHREVDELVGGYHSFSPDERERIRRSLFRKSIKAETVDEKHHVQRILSDPYSDHDKIPDPHPDPVHAFAKEKLYHGDLRRDWRSLNTPVSSIFVRSAILRIKRAAASAVASSPSSQRLLDLSCRIAALAESACASSGRLNPCNYPSLGLVIDLVRTAGHLKGDVDQALVKISEAIKAAYLSHEKGDPLPARPDVVDKDKDPLWQLAIALDIRRFVTINYDLELERLIDDLGFGPTSYATQEEETNHRVGPLGGQTREIVLDETNSTELLDFAASPGSYNIQVAHLHGRALEQEDIVLTERDYQAKYLGDEPHKIVTRQGLDTLFGSNPLVFVGVSLSEGDVVRPLREFRSGHSRRNQSVIALMAASAAPEKRKTAIMEQYIRNGIFVLHYGRRTEDGKRSSGGDFWLEQIFRFAGSIIAILDLLAKSVPRSDAKLKSLFEESAKDCAAFRSSGLATALTSAGFESDGAPCNVAFEYQLLEAIWQFLQDEPTIGGRSHSLLRRKFYGTVLRRAVKRIQGAMQTAALCSYLAGLEKYWHAWGSNQIPPQETRLNNLRYSTLNDLVEDTSAVPHPELRWFRHLVHGITLTPDKNLLRQSGSDPDERFQAMVRSWCSAVDQNQHRGGPRLLVVAAPRGAGKGTLHGQFAQHSDHLLGLPISPQHKTPPHRYKSSFSASLSFASEVSSIWDGLSAFLLAPERLACETVSDDIWQEKSGRIERVRRGLASARERHAGRNERILIVFHAFDLLFDQLGRPKNFEIAQICDVLFSSGHGAPIDFVLIVRDRRIPHFFRRTDPNARSLRLLPPVAEDSGSSNQVKILGAVRRTDVRVDVRGTVLADAMLPSENTEQQEYIYFLPSVSFEAHDRKDSLRVTAEKLLAQNRFQNDLFQRVYADREKANATEKKEKEGKERFAREMIDAAGRHNHISGDRFFEKVLDYWSARGFDREQDYEPFCSHLRQSGYPVDGAYESTIAHAHDFQLQELLLRHLAVISQPVEADVLAECPSIHARVKSLQKDGNGVRLVEYGLALLSFRGLCFTILDRSRSSTEEARGFHRYQVHRALQFHIHRRLGGQNTEPAENYTYSVSLYPSQGRDQLLLSAKAYAFLHELLNGLIGFPKEDNTMPNRSKSEPLQARCLRAGIGVARTLFSIGVVARFNDLGGVKVPIAPRPGYFEHHRLTLRWMLWESQRIGSAKMDEWRPFYPDELVWLYNECGVFSLAQGQMFDALAMFDTALRLAARIDGDGDSPIRRRILLNLTLCAINRGRPNEAKRWLEEVRAAPKEDPTIQFLAEGFMGVLKHISGEHDQAEVHYGTAIDGLIDLGRSRAASLFLRHRGDLYRHKGRIEDAQRAFADAIDHARFSGSEDMAWFAIVAKTRMEATHKPDFKTLLKRLEGAESYAEAMEMPQLTAEAAFVHAQILLRQGETALAAERASRALRIAGLNGLTIRAIAYRSLLSDIHRERGWETIAQRLKADTLQAARNAGYRTLLQRHANDSSMDDDYNNGSLRPDDLKSRLSV